MIKADLVSLTLFKTAFFKKFQDLLVREFGFYFSETRMESFRGVLLKHLKISPAESFEDYYLYLTSMSGRTHLQTLIEDITIGETFFFRNEPQLDVFKNYVIPELIKSKRSLGSNVIKIWSAGCSTGEEVYTLVMMLLENLPASKLWDIQVLGTDINTNSLKTCRDGIYSGYRPKKHLDNMLIEKYFDIIDDKFHVKPSLRQFTEFSKHNLIKDSYDFKQMVDVDVIFCRNVTIYFNTETTREVVNRFFKTLRDGGFMFIGHSETLWQITEAFRTIDFPKAFIYQKDSKWEKNKSKKEELGATAVIPELNLGKWSVSGASEEVGLSKSDIAPIPFGLTKRPLSPSIEVSGEVSGSHPEGGNLEKIMQVDILFHRGVVHFERKNFDAALVSFNEITDLDPQYLLAYFAKATIYSNQAKYPEAMEALQHLLQKDNLFLEAYYLKSVLHIKLHEHAEAIRMLQKVTYIDPNHALAYFNLANLQRELKQDSQCRLSWSNLQRICRQNEKTHIVPMSETLTYETLNALAEKALGELK